MNNSSRFACVGLVLIIAAQYSAAEPTATQGRDIAKSMGGRLEVALQAALAQSGPVEAIEVCATKAPQIASEFSRLSGAKVRRTSMRPRNPANAPEDWEARVLRGFAIQATAKEKTEPLEFFARQDDGSARYLLAIRTGDLCLTCHGKTLAPELEARLTRDYPYDRARGYSAGDIRGAFSISWPKAETTKLD